MLEPSIIARRPGWVPIGFDLAMDFANGRYFGGGPESQLSWSNGVNGWQPDSNGIFTQTQTSNRMRRTDLGMWIEEARTNLVLQNRDLSNAAWTKSNTTATKNQVGVDGVANSASSLTASAANGTCLQAITDASKARAQSCMIKRLTGSGNIQMTMDNGSTWTTVTVTSAWTKVLIPSQTLANPTVGFRIVTNGDAVAIDFVQNEAGTFPTNPIQTAGTSVTRAADTVTILLTGRLGRILASNGGVLLAKLGPTFRSEFSSTSSLIGDGSPGFVRLGFGSSTAFTNSAVGTLCTTPDISVNKVNMALSWGPATIQGSASGGTVGSQGSAGALDAGTWILGSYNNVSDWFNGPIAFLAAKFGQPDGAKLKSISGA